MPAVDIEPGLHAQLSALTLTASTGERVGLGSFWERSRAVLLHLRHFGCLFCRAQVEAISRELKAIEARGARVVAVGTGDVAYARAFVEKFSVRFPVLVDGALESYRAVGAGQRGLSDWARPQTIKAAALALKAGHMQGRLGPHQEFLGATHIIGPSEIIWAWRNSDFNDFAPPSDVLEVLSLE